MGMVFPRLNTYAGASGHDNTRLRRAQGKIIFSIRKIVENKREGNTWYCSIMTLGPDLQSAPSGFLPRYVPPCIIVIGGCLLAVMRFADCLNPKQVFNASSVEWLSLASVDRPLVRMGLEAVGHI